MTGAYKGDIYLICNKRRGKPKKHIEVCKRCRWNKTCQPYQNYCQPKLPIKTSMNSENRSSATGFTIVKVPEDKSGTKSFDKKEMKALLKEIKKELEEIRTICQ